MFGRQVPGEAEELRIHHVDEPLRLGGEILTLAHNDAVSARGREIVQRTSNQVLLAGEADLGNDGDAHAQFDVLLDDLPAPGLQRDVEAEVMLGEAQLDDAPGGQMPRG